MIHTSRQLKALVRNLSKTTGIESHVLIRRYMMERLMERVSLSRYKDSFVLKGGMLISSLLGVETRSTMDIDTTVKGIPVTVSDMERIMTEIISIPLEDDVSFSIKNISTIMEELEYNGIRLSLEAHLDNSVTPLKLDVSTGDVITPGETHHQYKLMFEDRTISLLAYPLETVLAEKLETVLSRSTLNSRMRDYYDLHLLYEMYSGEIKNETLCAGLTATASKRGTRDQLYEAESVLVAIEESTELKKLWDDYKKKYSYAATYTWEDVTRSVRLLSYDAGLPVQKPSIHSMLRAINKSDNHPLDHSKSVDFEL